MLRWEGGFKPVWYSASKNILVEIFVKQKKCPFHVRWLNIIFGCAEDKYLKDDDSDDYNDDDNEEDEEGGGC